MLNKWSFGEWFCFQGYAIELHKFARSLFARCISKQVSHTKLAVNCMVEFLSKTEITVIGPICYIILYLIL